MSCVDVCLILCLIMEQVISTNKFFSSLYLFFFVVKKCKMSPDLKCIRENYLRFAGSTFELQNGTLAASKWVQEKCECLPDCLLNAYPSEVSTGQLVRDYSRNSLSFFKDVNITDQSLVHIFFNDLISTHYRKDMYQNWLGVLAAFGGNQSFTFKNVSNNCNKF